MAALSTSWILLLLTLLAGSFVLKISATGDEIYENRAIKSASGEVRPFFVGSRYGRSQSDLSNMETPVNSEDKKARIVLRNDRFFLGSRYGKRSKLAEIDEDQDQILTCVYTGVTNIFRCTDSDDKKM